MVLQLYQYRYILVVAYFDIVFQEITVLYMVELEYFVDSKEIKYG